MISGMTITCFTGSYLLALAAAIARFIFRDRVRPWVGLILGGVGLFAHTLYLWKEANAALEGGSLVTVVTQAANLPAVRLYERLGFRASQVGLWYHRWFEPASHD